MKCTWCARAKMEGEEVCAQMHKVTHRRRTSWSQFSCVSVVLREVEEDGLIALTACDETKTVLWRASGRKNS